MLSRAEMLVAVLVILIANIVQYCIVREATIPLEGWDRLIVFQAQIDDLTDFLYTEFLFNTALFIILSTCFTIKKILFPKKRPTPPPTPTNLYSPPSIYLDHSRVIIHKHYHFHFE